MVTATSLVRKMRGGAQSHMLRCSDGNTYVVKFANNPQGRRILVNEWITSAIFRHLGLPTPEVALINIPEPIQGVGIKLGETWIDPTHGIPHLGSRYVSDGAVYDCLPAGVLKELPDLPILHASLAVDRWLSNADARQCVFYGGYHQGLRLSLIDHGYCFQGQEWRLTDNANQGLYHNLAAYETHPYALESAIRAISTFRPSAIRAIFASVPPEWLTSDDRAILTLLCEELISRRKRVQGMVHATYEYLLSRGLITSRRPPSPVAPLLPHLRVPSYAHLG